MAALSNELQYKTGYHTGYRTARLVGKIDEYDSIYKMSKSKKVMEAYEKGYFVGFVDCIEGKPEKYAYVSTEKTIKK